MKRLSWLLVLLALMVLAACGPADEGTANVDPTPTVAANGETPSAAETATAPAVALPADTGDFPVAETVADASVVRDADHIQGNRDARVVIYEYSDFQ